MDSKRKRKLKREFATLFSSDVTRLIAQTGFKFPPNVTDIMFEDEVGEPSPPTVPVAVKGAPAIAQLRPTDAPQAEVRTPIKGGITADPYATRAGREQAILDYMTANTLKRRRDAAKKFGVTYSDLNKWKVDRGSTLAKVRSSKVERIEQGLTESRAKQLAVPQT